MQRIATAEHRARGNTKNFQGIEVSGQACRAISTSQLHALLRFHSSPINLVVYQGPLRLASGNLVLGRASRLYAFSAYLNRTQLRSGAAGATAPILEVRPTRSSRTKASSPQVSSAHHR